MCQFKALCELEVTEAWTARALNRGRRLFRNIQHYTYVLLEKAGRQTELQTREPVALSGEELEICTGDFVRVRSREEINKKLDGMGLYKHYRGCPFFGEMYTHCGNVFKVFKKVNYFYDEAKKKLCKCRDIYLLEGAVCQGNNSLFKEQCDLMCFYFWHKAWLEKI